MPEIHTQPLPLQDCQAQNSINAYWTHRAHSYHANQTESPRARYDIELWAEQLKTYLPKQPQRVLDIGCGPGFLSHIMAKLGHDVTGIDAAEGMIAEARAQADATCKSGEAAPSFLLGNAMQLTFEDNTADVITNRFLLWTLLDPVQAIREWLRVLRPGGLLFCADANHFPHGINNQIKVDSEGGPDEFTQVYNPDLQGQLPLALEKSMEAYLRCFEEAGATDIQINPVDGVAEIDRNCGLPAGHESIRHYVITALRPR